MAIGESSFDLIVDGGDADLGMFAGKQDVMVEFSDELLEGVAEEEKIDHATAGVERAGDFGGDAVVVAVEALAEVFAEGDEMRGAEDEIVFGDADVVA